MVEEVGDVELVGSYSFSRFTAQAAVELKDGRSLFESVIAVRYVRYLRYQIGIASQKGSAGSAW